MEAALIREVRAFNRFYTNVIGLLDRYLVQTRYSLPEARILYELYHRKKCTASDIMQAVDIDKSYLSRMLQQFKKEGLIVRFRSPEDGRAAFLSLTAAGKTAFTQLNKASDNQVKHILQSIGKEQQKALVRHMQAIQKILDQRPDKKNVEQ